MREDHNVTDKSQRQKLIVQEAENKKRKTRGGKQETENKKWKQETENKKWKQETETRNGKREAENEKTVGSRSAVFSEESLCNVSIESR